MKRFAERVYIGAQLNPDDLPQLKAAGITHILCHRPDDEEPNQPSFAQISQAAQAQGIIAIHAPFTGANITEEAIEKTAALLNDEHAVAYLYCRSGTRSSLAWFDAMRQQGIDACSLHNTLAQNGYNLNAIR